MSVTAPPRPPRSTPPRDREELEALVKALIEEARQRARRRRRIYAAVVALVALVGAAVLVVLDRTAWSQSTSPAFSSRASLSLASAKPRIAFVTQRGGRVAIYVMNADGTGRRKVTTYTGGGWGFGELTWSPDAREIGYPASRSRKDDSVDIYVAKVDGSGERRLTSDPDADLEPSWSPDGRKIAFVRWGGQARYRQRDLYVMNADGSSQRKLWANTSLRPAWSPDGQTVAFLGIAWTTKGPPVGSDVYVMNADGNGERNLTRSKPFEDSFAWSPDGRRIAFIRRVRCVRCPEPERLGGVGRGGNSELWVMNADGSGQRRLARGQHIAAAPTWSPDGRTLVYESSYRPSPRSPRLKFWYVSELFRVNADGSGKRRLTYGAQPLWSPDGEKILFVGRRQGSADLWIMNPDGSGQRRLTRTPGYGERIFAWSPLLSR